MCGTPYFESRTTVTSERGLYVRAMSPGLTPNVESLKKRSRSDSLKPGTA